MQPATPSSTVASWRRAFVGSRTMAAAALCVVFCALLMASPVAARLGDSGAGAVAGVDARTLYNRVHIIGASASAGFGLRPPLPQGHPGRMQPLSLTRIAQAAAAGGVVTGDATSLFFVSPITTGKHQVEAVLGAKDKPTLVMGVDYLFWFTYGAADAERQPIKQEAQRLAMLEVGLANLDLLVKAGIPVVVGDLPNMSQAVGKMLSPAQMPKQETLDAANKRIRAWAAERSLTTVVPLAELVLQLDGDTPFQAGSRTWSTKADGPLIQADRLHPTFAGSVALLARAEQATTEHYRPGEAPGMATTAFEHDPAKVAKSLQKLIEADLAARNPAAQTPAPR